MSAMPDNPDSDSTASDKPGQSQPYPDWTSIKARITPGMLGPRIEPEPTDWTEIASDEPTDESGPASTA